jgi:predicted amidohydrolase
MWNIGYQFPDYKQPDGLATFAAQAISRDSAFVQHFKNMARELQMAIGITYLELWPERPRNSLSLIDRHGEIVLHYAKVHTCEFDAESMLTPGDGFPAAELDTAQGTVKIGAMICFDREFPESARILMLNGAEIILTPNACGLEINRLTQYRARAFENMVGLAMTNYAAPDQNGHSIAYDGMPFSNTAAGKDGEVHDMLLIEAGSAEGIYLARFDVEALRRYRELEGMGNAYRRPRLYHALIDEHVDPPFVRDDATR